MKAQISLVKKCWIIGVNKSVIWVVLISYKIKFKMLIDKLVLVTLSENLNSSKIKHIILTSHCYTMLSLFVILWLYTCFLTQSNNLSWSSFGLVDAGSVSELWLRNATLLCLWGIWNNVLFQLSLWNLLLLSRSLSVWSEYHVKRGSSNRLGGCHGETYLQFCRGDVIFLSVHRGMFSVSPG